MTCSIESLDDYKVRAVFLSSISSSDSHQARVQMCPSTRSGALPVIHFYGRKCCNLIESLSKGCLEGMLKTQQSLKLPFYNKMGLVLSFVNLVHLKYTYWR